MAEPRTRFDVDKAIVEKAARDEAFRTQLIADPKGTLATEVHALTGKEQRLPENLTVTVHEETPEQIHLVIPATASPAAELSDEELAQVAGGWVYTGCPTWFVCVSGCV